MTSTIRLPRHRRSLRAIALLACSIALLVLSAVPAVGKEFEEAVLDAPIPMGLPGGTEIMVGVSVTTAGPNGEVVPIEGTPVYLKLFGPGGSFTRAAGAGDRTPGHYTMRIAIPDGGARRIEVGVHGTSDLAMRVANDPFTFGGITPATAQLAPSLAAPATARPVADAPTVAAPAPTPVTVVAAPSPVLALAGAAAMLLLLAAATAIVRAAGVPPRPTPPPRTGRAGSSRGVTGAPDDALDAADADEAALVRRARAGDPDAYGQLVTMHQGAAFRVAWLLTGSAADAEDAAQEAFVKAYLALDRFRDGSAFRPWLLAVVGNEARNRRRAASRREGLAARALAAVRGSQARSTTPHPVAGESGTLSVAVVQSPELAILAGETRAEVHAALAALADEERRVVTCRYLLGLSEAETAAALGIPAGTAKSRLHRGLRRMRDVLETTTRAAEPGR